MPAQETYREQYERMTVSMVQNLQEQELWTRLQHVAEMGRGVALFRTHCDMK